jgi:hypothetical protein
MTHRLSLLAVAAVVLMPASSRAAETVTRSVVVTAQFDTRTSLTVSTQFLQFQVVNPELPATASVDFSAAARTFAGGEVVLSVEPICVEGPGGSTDAKSALTFTGEGEGTLDGVARPAAPTVAGRWVGSGARSGRLLFSLHAAASGTYAVPVRFVLSAP